MNSTDLENIRQLTPEQVEIYSILKNMRFKEIVMWVIIFGFFVVLTVFILEICSVITSDWSVKTITAVLNGILGHTMYPLVNHFFPARMQAKAIENNGVQ